MKNIVIAIVLVLIIGAGIGVWLFSNQQVFFKNQGLPRGESVTVSPATSSADNQSINLDRPNAVEYDLEIVAENLNVPWSIVFVDDNLLYVSERSGQIRIIRNDTLLPKPLIDISEVTTTGEAGLMGLALDPKYQDNHWLYACYAYNVGSGLADKIVKLEIQNDSARVVDTIIENIPAAHFHAGCRIKIGPDQKLYVTTGDATDKNIAQSLESLGGKILRINLDGSIPNDNPIPKSYIYSYGHRNPQGIAWHPISGQLYETEHGPSGNDGPGGGDEVNLIQPGGNYGWPTVSHRQSQPGLIDPLLVFTPAEAPGSALIYSNNVFPQFTHNLLFGALRGEGIIRIILDETLADKIVSYEKLPIDVGRIRDVVESPDGLIYFSTSNMDGRGQVRQNDDKIYRLVPQD